MRTAIRIGLIGLLTTFAAAAHAQSPTTAQRNAIRQSCSADYQSVCAGVPTGGRAALQCLQQHSSSLSSSCQSAVAAVSGGGGGGSGGSSGGSGGGQQPPARPQQPAQAAGRPAEACRSDFGAYCRGIRPGGGRAMMCLREHAAELSPGCQDSLASMRR